MALSIKEMFKKILSFYTELALVMDAINGVKTITSELNDSVSKVCAEFSKVEKKFNLIDRKAAEADKLADYYEERLRAYQSSYLDMTRLLGEYKKEAEYTRAILEDIQHVVNHGPDKPFDPKAELVYPVLSPKKDGGTQDS